MLAMKWLWPLVLSVVNAVVDELGRYRVGSDITKLAPPEPSEEDRKAATELSQQPMDKIFKLLAFELWREERRPRETKLNVRDFQLLTELSCPERIAWVSEDATTTAKELESYHLNVTGTAGLYWLTRDFPQEHSWAWLLASSHDRMKRRVESHFTRLSAVAVNDEMGCFTSNFRTVLMQAAVFWRKLHGDFVALLWNSIAFGVLGDVTSWRDIEDDGKGGETMSEGPGGPPPNVSWSENIIFGNMYISSISKWFTHHSSEMNEWMKVELTQGFQAARKAGREEELAWLPSPDPPGWRVASDGLQSSFEILRGMNFGGSSMDKGLLRGLLRHVLRPDYERPMPSVGDFGAGLGKHSVWLNETGLVEAVAFDGSRAVTDITHGIVNEADFANDNLRLWRSFDWAMVLDVVARTSLERAKSIVRSAARHSKLGLILAWALPQEGLAAAPLASLPEKEVISLVERETGFHLEPLMTSLVRAQCELPGMKDRLLIFVASS